MDDVNLWKSKLWNYIFKSDGSILFILLFPTKLSKSMQISPVMRTINETHGSLKQKKVGGKGAKKAEFIRFWIANSSRWTAATLTFSFFHLSYLVSDSPRSKGTAEVLLNINFLSFSPLSEVHCRTWLTTGLILHQFPKYYHIKNSYLFDNTCHCWKYRLYQLLNLKSIQALKNLIYPASFWFVYKENKQTKKILYYSGQLNTIPTIFFFEISNLFSFKLDFFFHIPLLGM